MKIWRYTVYIGFMCFLLVTAALAAAVQWIECMTNALGIITIEQELN